MSPAVLSPGYKYGRRPETVEQIGRAAAGLLGLDPDRVVGWLAGNADKDLAGQINQMARLRRCTACGEWFDEDLINKDLCKCDACIRSPGINAWIADVDARISKAPVWMQNVWAMVKSGGPITYVRMAVMAKRRQTEFRAAWALAGLPDRPAGRGAKNEANKCICAPRQKRWPC